MAQTTFEFPIRSVSGAIDRHGVVNRKKTFRTPEGCAVAEGPNETYKVMHPRNYKKNPPVGRERDNLLLNKKAWTQAALELQDEKSERYQYWLTRYKAQLVHGEADAPMDPATGKTKVYHSFRAFVRTAIRRQILQSSQTQEKDTNTK